MRGWRCRAPPHPPGSPCSTSARATSSSLVASDDGWPIETISTPNTATTSDRYLAYDLAALEAWFLDALAEVARRHPIGAVIATAHGCGAVLTDGHSAVLPMMDYEAVSPPEIDSAYDLIAPPYTEVFCSNGSGAMRLAKQLLWQQTAYPVEFPRATAYLTTAQYLALRLGGRAASEISQLAAQGHIWDAVGQRPSSIMRARGWDRLLPPLAVSGEVLGTLSETVIRRTGLSPATQILCGAHDSNANLFRYKAAGLHEASVLSTGTWMIGFNRGLDPARLDPVRAMVLEHRCRWRACAVDADHDRAGIRPDPARPCRRRCRGAGRDPETRRAANAGAAVLRRR